MENNDFEAMITIGFNYTSEEGYTYSSESTTPVFHTLGENELDVIGRQLNAFLAQAGYVRHNTDMFMEDLTEDEVSFLECALAKYRDEPKISE